MVRDRDKQTSLATNFHNMCVIPVLSSSGAKSSLIDELKLKKMSGFAGFNHFDCSLITGNGWLTDAKCG